MWRVVFPVLLLLFTGVSGLRNGFHEYRDAVTNGQRFATATEVAYGIVSWIALVALLRKRPWARVPLVVWAALVTLTASVAAVTWGDAGLGGAAAGGISVAAVCGLAVWLAETWRLRQATAAAGSK